MGYIFDPDLLHQITKRHTGLPLEEAFDAITRDLAAEYPAHIDQGRRSWIFNNAGGAMGQMTLLHASLSEYVIIFGTPIGTEGHSGRYGSEVFDFMIDGEMWTYHEGECERTTYKPGDAAYLGKDRVKGYRVPERAWMLEYSRGPIPTMLPFGLADTVFSTLDMKTMARTFYHYGGKTVRALMRGKI